MILDFEIENHQAALDAYQTLRHKERSSSGLEAVWLMPNNAVMRAISVLSSIMSFAFFSPRAASLSRTTLSALMFDSFICNAFSIRSLSPSIRPSPSSALLILSSRDRRLIACLPCSSSCCRTCCDKARSFSTFRQVSLSASWLLSCVHGANLRSTVLSATPSSELIKISKSYKCHRLHFGSRTGRQRPSRRLTEYRR